MSISSRIIVAAREHHRACRFASGGQRIVRALVALLVGVAWIGDLRADGPPASLVVGIGPERIVLAGALQPFLFRSSRGVLIAQGHMDRPPGYERPAGTSFPGLPSWVVSGDGGKSWRIWKPTDPKVVPPMW